MFRPVLFSFVLPIFVAAFRPYLMFYVSLAVFDGRRSGRLRRSQCSSVALISAVTGHHIECVRLLLDAGADKNAQEDVRGMC